MRQLIAVSLVVLFMVIMFAVMIYQNSPHGPQLPAISVATNNNCDCVKNACYFVSYAYFSPGTKAQATGTGAGNMDVCLSSPIVDFRQVHDIRGFIARTHEWKENDVVLLNYERVGGNKPFLNPGRFRLERS